MQSRRRWATSATAAAGPTLARRAVLRQATLRQGTRDTIGFWRMPFRWRSTGGASKNGQRKTAPKGRLTTQPGRETRVAMEQLREFEREVDAAFQSAFQSGSFVADEDQMRMQANVRACVADLSPLIDGMKVEDMMILLKMLAAIRWYDEGLLQQLAGRAQSIIPKVDRGGEIADLLHQFARLASGPLQLSVDCPDGAQPGGLIEVRKKHLFAPHCTKTPKICQDKLGTHTGKAEKVRFCRWNAQGKKTALFEPFIYKMHYFTKTGSGQS